MKRWIFFAALVLMPSVGWAAEPMDLTACVEYGLFHNLQLRNARADQRIAIEQALGVDHSYDPRLSANLTHTDSSVQDVRSFLRGDKEITDASFELAKPFRTGTRVGLAATYTHLDFASTNFFPITPHSSTVTLSFSQSILKNAFGKMDRAKLQSVHLNAEVVGHLLVHEQHKLGMDIAEGYWNLYAARMNYQATRDSVERASDFLKTNRKRLEDGLLDETDILAAEALLATRAVEVLTFSNQVDNAADVLKNLIQIPRRQRDAVSFAFPQDPAAALDNKPAADATLAWAIALKSRPDLTALRTLETKAGTDIEIRKGDTRGDLEIVGSLSGGANENTRADVIAVEDTGWALGVTFAMPLGGGAEQSALEQARIGLEKAQNNTTALIGAIGLECATATRDLLTSHARLHATKKALRLHQKKLSLEKQKFSQGRSDMRWLVQYEDDRTNAEAIHAAAAAAYHKAALRYRLVQGLAPVEPRP